MSKQWSESAQQATREAIDELSFGSRDGKVFCKHIDGTFGYMNDAELIEGRYAIHSRIGTLIAEFESVKAMLAEGWVLD